MGRLVRKAIIIFHHSLVNSIKRYGEPEDIEELCVHISYSVENLAPLENRGKCCYLILKSFLCERICTLSTLSRRQLINMIQLVNAIEILHFSCAFF